MKETTTTSFDKAGTLHQPTGGRAGTTSSPRPSPPVEERETNRLVRYLAATCGLLLAASAMGQQPDVATDATAPKAVHQTNNPAITAEEPDATKESKQESNEWDWDWDWEGKERHGVRREAVVAIR